MADPRAHSARRPRDERRAQVLDAALLAIRDRGPERVRVSDIAQRAQMSPSHVLYFFGRKDRILIETLRMSEEDLLARLGPELDRIADPWAAVRRWVRRYLPTAQDDLRWNLWAQLMARPPADGESLGVLERLESAWSPPLQKCIRRGAEGGAFPAVDAVDLAENTRYLLDGFAMDILLGVPGHTSAWAQRRAERFLRAFLTPVG